MGGKLPNLLPKSQCDSRPVSQIYNLHKYLSSGIEVFSLPPTPLRAEAFTIYILEALTLVDYGLPHKLGDPEGLEGPGDVGGMVFPRGDEAQEMSLPLECGSLLWRKP